jgi:hypothetical protein
MPVCVGVCLAKVYESARESERVVRPRQRERKRDRDRERERESEREREREVTVCSSNVYSTHSTQ